METPVKNVAANSPKAEKRPSRRGGNLDFFLASLVVRQQIVIPMQSNVCHAVLMTSTSEMCEWGRQRGLI